MEHPHTQSEVDRRRFFAADDSDRLSSHFLREFRHTLYRPATKNPLEFFESVAAKCASVFGAKAATIWENSLGIRCDLILIAAFPRLIVDQITKIIPADFCAGYKAIVSGDMAITHVRERQGQAPPYLDSTPDDFVICSIPIHSWFDAQLQLLVLNLHFPEGDSPSSRVSSLEATLLSEELSRAFHDILAQTVEWARAAVWSRSHALVSMSKICKCVHDGLTQLTELEGTALFSLDGDELHFEHAYCGNGLLSCESVSDWLIRRNPNCTPSENDIDTIQCWQQSVLEFNHFETAIYSRFLSLDQLSRPRHLRPRAFDEMIVPLYASNTNTPIGVLWSHGKGSYHKSGPLLSGFDHFVLEELAREIGHHFSRLLDNRKQTVLQRVVGQIAGFVRDEMDLDKVLSYSIVTLAHEISATIGAIYIFEQDRDTYVMRAGAGDSECLVGIAEYSRNEGITGLVARHRQVMRFDSYQAMNGHPAFSGKYDHTMWPNGESRCETLIAAPILVNDECQGVIKLGNIRSTALHPDPFFTEHDVSAVKALASFLAIYIERDVSRTTIEWWRTIAGRDALQMLRAPDETSVLNCACEILNKLRFGCMLSLFDQSTGFIQAQFTTSDKWNRIKESTRVHIRDNDIIAVTLRENSPEFVTDALTDPRCNKSRALDAGILSFYVIPLRIDDELIGVLQFDTTTYREPPDRVSTHRTRGLLAAFSGMVAVALWRFRIAMTRMQAAQDVRTIFRKAIVETLSCSIIHDLAHKIDSVIRDVQSMAAMPNLYPKMLLSSLHAIETELHRIEEKARSDLSDMLAGTKLIPVDVVATIRRAAAIARTAHPQLIVNETNDAAKWLTYGSPASVLAIITECIDNAVDAGASSVILRTSNDVNVQCDIHVIENAIIIEIIDNGRGAPGVELTTLFTRGFSTKGTEVDGQRGMGLYIVQELALRLGGDVEAFSNSASHGGLTLRIVLPLFEEIAHG